MHVLRHRFGHAVAITSTLVSVLGSYTVVFPVAIGMTAIAAISVLGIKRVR